MISCIFRGGLANNIFQSATAFAFGLKHKVDVILPTTIDNPHYEGQQVHRFPGFKYSDDIIPLPIFEEQQFHYKPLPFMDYVKLSGYWQSWRYFNDYKKELIEALGVKYEMKNATCSVHVRRGDYLNNPDVHPPITKEYIYAAMDDVFEKTNGNITFEIFSDDTAWCSQILWASPFNKFTKNLHSGNSEIRDLIDMSNCEHNITANSAFSWFGAYLNQNPNKIVIHPKKWFGSEYRHQNTRDLYLPNSTIL